MAASPGSNTCHIPVRLTRSLIVRVVPASSWRASDTLGVEKLPGSYSYGIQRCTPVGASVAVSKQNWASSTPASKVVAAHIVVGEQNTPAFVGCWDAGRNGHVVGCRISGPGYSRKKVTVPGLGGIENPFLPSRR